MQTMPDALSLRGGRSVSMGALLALGGGLALYQMTSLVLGPDSSRQLPLSLSIPVTQVEELSDQMASNVNLVLGSRVSAAPAAAAPSSHPVVASTLHPRIAPHAGPASGPSSAPAPVVTPEPKTAPHPPVLRPTPPAETLPVSSND